MVTGEALYEYLVPSKLHRHDGPATLQANFLPFRKGGVKRPSCPYYIYIRGERK